MTDRDLQDQLKALIEELIECEDDDDDPADFRTYVEGIKAVFTYDDTGLLTTDKGLVVECADGREFQITIIQSK